MTPRPSSVRLPGPRLLSAVGADYPAHLDALGALPNLGTRQVELLALDAGLTGRGGAGFPTGRKLAAVRDSTGHAVVIGNGAEGEPASSKDRVLLTTAPHLVLDGLALAATAVDADQVHLYAPSDLLDDVIAPALAQRQDRIAVSLVPASDLFLSGQETAAVRAVEGRPAIPRITPPPVFIRGVHGRPTLVQNVETLAHLALIGRFGANWFRSAGTEAEPGTRLVTVSGGVARPDVYEIAGGSSIGEVLDLAGGIAEPVQAVLVGGYHGGWVPYPDETANLPLTRESLAPYDAAPGAGVLIALPASRCGLQAAADITLYLAGQNAGQCGPCRNGLPTLAMLLDALAYGRTSQDLVDEISRIAGLVDGRGACHHPAGTIRLVRSALRTFSDEIRRHIGGGCISRRFT